MKFFKLLPKGNREMICDRRYVITCDERKEQFWTENWKVVLEVCREQ